MPEQDAQPESELASDEASCDIDDRAATSSAKKVRKRLKDAEESLSKELARYKEIAKKAKHELGGGTLLEDRERVKKAEWMHDSVRHYLKESGKKAAKQAVEELGENFHLTVAESIADVKAARKRLKGLLSAH